MESVLRTKLRLLGSARGISGLIGVWLFVSAFVLPRPFDGVMVAWIAGFLVLADSTASFFAAEGRYVDRVLAVLLAVSALVVPAIAATRIHDACIAALLFALSFVSIRHGTLFHGHAH